MGLAYLPPVRSWPPWCTGLPAAAAHLLAPLKLLVIVPKVAAIIVSSFSCALLGLHLYRGPLTTCKQAGWLRQAGLHQGRWSTADGVCIISKAMYDLQAQLPSA